MKRSGRIIQAFVIVFALAFAASSEAAQCAITDTITTCIERFNDESKKALPARVESAKTAGSSSDAAQQANELASKPTGVQTGGQNLASNTTNFIPLLSLTGLLGQAKQGDNAGTYVLDLNFLIPAGLAVDKNTKLQAIVNTQPQVSDGVKDQFPADKRDELVQGIEGGLGNLSDYALNLTYNWNDRRHGRGFNHYRDRYAALATAVARRFIEANGEPVGFDKVSAKIATLVQGLKDFSEKPFEELNDPKNSGGRAGVGTELELAVEKAAAEEQALLASDREIRLKAGLGHFADLLDNQPQLMFSAHRSFRDPVVGGNETSGKLSYEWGRANLNNALLDCQDELDTPAPDKLDSNLLSRCLDQYTSYVNKNEALLKNGDKFSFSAEYLNVNSQVFSLPAQGLTGLKIDAAKKLIVSAGWSHQFPVAMGGDQPLRLDFVGSYENVSNDPQRQDRGVATLTITQKIGGVTVPLGIVYANHGEFLGDVDKKFSAHFGIKVDLGSKETAAAAGN